ncbi:MAG: glutamate racemase [Cyanobium sp.]
MSPLIGLFDSGLGGLTVLRQLLSRRPRQPCLYLGDTARLPYGQRSPEEIRAIAGEVVRWLHQQGVELLVMACNTTNALAFDIAVAEAGVPVVGLIDSAAAALNSKRVGVLATSATVASGAYSRAIRANHPSARVVEVACPAFVPLIEAGQLHGPAIEEAALEYLRPLLQAGVESVVLGCTHYPLLAPLLERLLPKDVRLVDPAEATAHRLVALLGALGDGPIPGQQRLPSLPEPLADCRFCVTGDALTFARAAAPLIGREPTVEQVCLRSAG